MKRRITLLLTAIVATLGFVSTASTPQAVKYRSQESRSKAPVTSVFNQASTESSAQTYTPVRYITHGAKNNVMSVPSKVSSTASKAAPIAQASSTTTYPNLHASVTTYPAARYSRIAKLPFEKSGTFESKLDYVWSNYGGVGINHYYYYFTHQAIGSSTRYSNALWRYSTDDWATYKRIASDDDLPISVGATDVALNPVDGKVYGCFFKDESEGTGYVFGTVDYDNVTRTKICDLPDQWNAFAIDSKGTGYAIDMNGQLLKVNLANGSTTVVGSTGLKPYYVSSATIDVKSDRMFYACLTQEAKSSLYEINTATAAATHIVDYDDETQICGMFVPTPIAEDDAPATPTNVAANFPKGTLIGAVEFDLPSHTYAGDTLTGKVNYVVTSSISDTVRGIGLSGERVAVPVIARERGYVQFHVRAYNSVGQSPEATTSLAYIGPGKPAAPTNVTLTISGDTAKLTWKAAASADNFYFDSDSIRYTVYRMPGSVEVYDGYDTEFSELVATDGDFTKLSYKVLATTRAGISSAKLGSSNGVSFGSIVPPYSEGFDTSSDYAGYTIVDANGDGRTWQYFAAQKCMYAKYAPKVVGDDWLITPPVKLKAGESYQFGVDIKNTQRYDERFEIKCGTAATAEGMTVSLVDTTDLAQFTTVRPEVYYKAPADGIYYFGIHYVGLANKYGIYADNVAISAGIAENAPDSVGAPVVDHDPNGAIKATIAFTAPTKDMTGAAIAKVDSINVERDGVAFKQFGSTAAGQSFSFEDTDSVDASHKYTCTAYLNGNAGRPVSYDIYIGIGVPDTVQNAKIVEDKNAVGTVNITWDAPAGDVNGTKLNSSVYNYTVSIYGLDGSLTVVGDSITDQKFTYNVTDSTQQYTCFYIKANDRIGQGSGVYTDVIPVGPADKVPFVESFTNATTSHPWLNTTIIGYPDGAATWCWSVCDDKSIDDFTSYDDDNGFAVFYGLDTFISAFSSGKINLTGLAKPELTYYTYNIDTDDVNVLTSQISTDNGKTWTSLKATKENTLPHTGWNRISVDLSSYAGKEIRLRWLGDAELYSHVFLDNIKIAETVTCDVAAIAITAPSKATTGEDFDVAVTVENQSSKAASNVNVTLYCNDKAVADSTITSLAGDDAKQIVFKQQFNNVAESSNNYYGIVSVDGDQNVGNNYTDTLEVAAKFPTLPTPTNLKGEATGNTVSLNWTAPDLSNVIPDPVIETFETANCDSTFATTFGDWTFVDEDQKPIGGNYAVAYPGIDYESQQSWFVIDVNNSVFSSEGLKRTYAAYSGTKYLSNMFLYSDGKVDDWAISPALAGTEQEISLYARCLAGDYKETFQILYSTTDKQISSFKQVDSDVSLQTTTWTKYNFTLPEGAKYFAIRCITNAGFSLLIDNVSYTPAASGEGATLEGYNVYRDGVKINDEVVTTNSYVDSNLGNAEEYTYCVTALIKDRGESAGSNKVTVKNTTGIDGTEVNRAVVSVDYYDTLGRKVVEPAAGQVVIERTTYDDGTQQTVKTIVK